MAHFSAHGDGCASSQFPPIAAIAGRSWQGLTILELGAGTGAVGLAASILGGSVTITDQALFRFPNGGGGHASRFVPKQDTLLDLMSINVRDNAGANRGAHAVEVAEMLWGDAAHMARLGRDGGFDVICGADILLFDSAHPALVATLRALSTETTVVVIEHTDRSGASGEDAFPKDLRGFLECVAEDGLWTPRVVADHGRHLTLRMVRTGAGEAPFGGVLRRGGAGPGGNE